MLYSECMCVVGVYIHLLIRLFVFLFKQKTAYEMRISDWSSDVCSSDLCRLAPTAPWRGAHCARDARVWEGGSSNFFVAPAALTARAGLPDGAARPVHGACPDAPDPHPRPSDRKSTRLNSSH